MLTKDETCEADSRDYAYQKTEEASTMTTAELFEAWLARVPADWSVSVWHEIGRLRRDTYPSIRPLHKWTVSLQRVDPADGAHLICQRYFPTGEAAAKAVPLVDLRWDVCESMVKPRRYVPPVTG